MEALAGQKLSLAGYGGASLSLKTAAALRRQRADRLKPENVAGLTVHGFPGVRLLIRLC